jgi:hypothetical protein
MPETQTHQQPEVQDPALEAIRRIETRVNAAFDDMHKRLERLERLSWAAPKAQEAKPAAPENEKKPWYKTTAFRVGIGVAGAAAVVGGGVAISRSRSRAKAAKAEPTSTVG